jgi:hypothetical protein
MKRKMNKPKALKGALKQTDTLSSKRTMGNPGNGKASKARAMPAKGKGPKGFMKRMEHAKL